MTCVRIAFTAEMFSDWMERQHPKFSSDQGSPISGTTGASDQLQLRLVRCDDALWVCASRYKDLWIAFEGKRWGRWFVEFVSQSVECRACDCSWGKISTSPHCISILLLQRSKLLLRCDIWSRIGQAHQKIEISSRVRGNGHDGYQGGVVGEPLRNDATSSPSISCRYSPLRVAIVNIPSKAHLTPRYILYSDD
jgi:hypothetical protein